MRQGPSRADQDGKGKGEGWALRRQSPTGPSNDRSPAPSWLFQRSQGWHPIALVGLLVGAAGAFVGVALYSDALGCSDFHLKTQFLGDASQLSDFLNDDCSGFTMSDAASALVSDLVFALVYGLALSLALGRVWAQGWRSESFTSLASTMFALPLFAALADAAENVVTFSMLQHADAEWTVKAVYGADSLPLVVTVLAWTKWVLVLAAGLGLVLASLGWLGFLFAGAGTKDFFKILRSMFRALFGKMASGDPAPDEEESADDTTQASGGDDTIGVCLSGGGIRSAGFSLGALQALAAKGVLAETRWITSVSGGGYAAAAWYIAGGPSKPKILDKGRDEYRLYEFLVHYRRYLSTGRGGLPRTILRLLRFLATNVLLIATALYLLASFFGYFLSSSFVQPDLGEKTIEVGWRVTGPGVALLGIAGIFLVFSLLFWDPTHGRVLERARIFALGGVALLVLLVAAPWVIQEMPDLLNSLGGLIDTSKSEESEGTRILAALSALGVTGALWAVAKKPLAKAAPRLGGVLLALGAFLFAAAVAVDAAREHDLLKREVVLSLGDLRLPLPFWVIAVGFGLVYFYLDAQKWSLNRIYHDRLRTTFATTDDESQKTRWAQGYGGVYPLAADSENNWSEYEERGPELIVCAAAQRSSNEVTGIPAVSFTFSRSQVTLYSTSLGEGVEPETEAYWSPWDRYGEAVRPRYATVSGAVAISGAAFTSAMGRHSLGSTNALLAALNVRLGVWMPNPRFVKAGDAIKGYKRPRLSYLVKEIFGHFDVDNDPYVYVTDGGHWENLGLVELVRKRCKTIFCIDASGDAVGSFGTLREAIELASLECQTEISIDLDPLKPDNDTGLSETNCVRGRIKYPKKDNKSAFVGALYYVKAGVARGSSLAVRSFGVRDRRFPRYSTVDQFLKEEEFEHLVSLGREATEKAVEMSTSGSQGSPATRIASQLRDLARRVENLRG